MSITADELAAIRDWVPTTWAPTELFDDLAVTAAFDRLMVEADDSSDEATEAASLANVYSVALALSRRFLAVVVGDPDSFSIGGEYSESRGAGINMLRAQITELAHLSAAASSLVSGSSQVKVLQICRPNWHGR